MDQAVEVVPGFAEVGKQCGDLFVAADVAIEDQRAVEFFGEFGDAILEAFAYIGKGEFSAFALAGGSDAVCDGAVR
ncbi:hypothetical protein D3C81_2268060 [compost metagenome]